VTFLMGFYIQDSHNVDYGIKTMCYEDFARAKCLRHRHVRQRPRRPAHRNDVLQATGDATPGFAARGGGLCILKTISGRNGDEVRREWGVVLSLQSYERIGKHALIAHQRYARAKQFKRATRRCANSARFWAASSATSRAGSKINSRCARFSRVRSISPSACASKGRSAGQEGLFPARARGRMHRQGQGASPLRVRRESVGGDDAASLEGRSVRGPCEGAAG